MFWVLDFGFRVLKGHSDKLRVPEVLEFAVLRFGLGVEGSNLTP